MNVKKYTALTFEEALIALKMGLCVTRKGWYADQKQFLFMVAGSQFQVNRPPLLGIFPAGTEISYCPHIDIRLLSGAISVWTPSQVDLFAEDWEIGIEVA